MKQSKQHSTDIHGIVADKWLGGWVMSAAIMACSGLVGVLVEWVR